MAIESLRDISRSGTSAFAAGGAGYWVGPTAPDTATYQFWLNTTAGVFLVWTGTEWIEPGANYVPTGGTAGQALLKVSGTDFDLAWGAPTVDWAAVTGKPATFAPSAHSHVIADVTGLQTALDGKQAALGFTPEDAAQKGATNGYVPLVGGLVPSIYLPGFVDDVLEAATFAALPVTGETGKLYVTLDNNKQYRWSGSAYVEINPSPGTTDALVEGAANLYFTVARVLATAVTGLSTATNATITAADTVLGALGKLQAQITGHFGAGGAVHADVVAGGASGFMTGGDKTKLNGIATGATAVTNADIRAQVEAALQAGTNITITPASAGATRTLTIASTGGGGGGVSPALYWVL